ncbi:MAG TPA: polymer-forming cytoskeletal protein [Pseudomonadales bacterium]
MFGNKDKNNKTQELEKPPTSFSNPAAPVVPKAAAGKDGKLPKSSSTTLIARDTEIFGDIKFSGNLEIEGSVHGNITANPSVDAAIRVLEDGHVEGDIHVPRANINGHIKGNVHASALELAAKARVEGNVHYETLEMLKGAQINGNLVYAENGVATRPQKQSGNS